MPDTSRRFDPYIPDVKSDQLKRMVRIYGGKSSMRKQECIDFLLGALDEPSTVRKAIASLEPFEMLSLALVKQMGGSMDYGTLGLGVLASGVEVPNRLVKRDFANSLTRHLLDRGLILNAGHRVGSFYAGHGGRTDLFSDPRLLTHVGAPGVEPMALDVVEAPTATLVRMPPTVILEIVGCLQTLENIGGLGLTKMGDMRVNDLRKFRKGMQWSKDDIEVDGLIFKDALNGLIQALRYSDLLEFSDEKLVLKRPVQEVTASSYATQVSTLVNGFLRLSDWRETDEKRWSNYYDRYYQQGRMALLMALASLPLETDQFCSLDEFDRALFARIGEHFSLEGQVHRYLSTYGKTPAEIKQMEAQWRTEKRDKWLQKERPWIEQALSSWLYFLGMVELGVKDKRVVSFRLTKLGKAVLHPGEDIPISTTVVEDTAGAWIVQPNLEMIVYLDRTTAAQLAFVEQHAERTQSQRYTAHYRLTRESVYRGLESGTTVNGFLEELAQHAQTPLPQNVTTEIRAWATLREQVVLHQRTHLLEFATPAARQDAQNANIKGRPVGDRFLLITPSTLAQYRRPRYVGIIEWIDYDLPLEQNLSVDETGLITLTADASDLLLEALLDQWAERRQEGRWQLTPASVSAHVKAGAKINELIVLLTKRSTGSVPLLLKLALRNWAGQAKKIEFERPIVFRCSNAAVLDAVLQSERLRPYLRGRLGDDLLIFDSEEMEAVQEILDWAGLKRSSLSLP